MFNVCVRAGVGGWVGGPACVSEGMYGHTAHTHSHTHTHTHIFMFFFFITEPP